MAKPNSKLEKICALFTAVPGIDELHVDFDGATFTYNDTTYLVHQHQNVLTIVPEQNHPLPETLYTLMYQYFPTATTQKVESAYAWRGQEIGDYFNQ